METFYIKEEKLNNGKSRYTPIMKTQNQECCYNETFLLELWYPSQGSEYTYSFELAKDSIEKQKEKMLNTSLEIEETTVHLF